MLIIQDLEKTKKFVQAVKKEGKRIGLVPTMGYLHQGHLSLVEAAKKSCDVVIVSIFVNPLQFGPKEDFTRYPRDLERDQKLLESFGVDLLFYPTSNAMFPKDFSTYVEEVTLSQGFCGESRPGHFRGVTTVVLKLFELLKPGVAFFGQKDFQQQLIIKKMTKDLNLDVEIVTLPTVREKDGLAMSSRNAYLSPKQRQAALVLYETLTLLKEKIMAGITDRKKLLKAAQKFYSKEKLFKLNYLDLLEPETLLPKRKVLAPVLLVMAGHIGKIRLIDNFLIG